MPEAEVKNLYIKDFQLLKCLLEAVEKYYGQYGLGIVEHGFKVKYCNESTKVAIVRCAHRSYQYVTSILPLITLVSFVLKELLFWKLKQLLYFLFFFKIGDVRAKFHTIYTGATIMQCNKFIIRHQQAFLERMVGKITSAKERQDLIKRVLEFDLD